MLNEEGLEGGGRGVQMTHSFRNQLLFDLLRTGLTLFRFLAVLIYSSPIKSPWILGPPDSLEALDSLDVCFTRDHSHASQGWLSR